MTDTKFQWTKIAHDINGNPRYVLHFLNLLTEEELISNSPNKYEWAVKRANKIGGRKYHTKAYGGGIVFQSYSIDSTERDIARVLAEGK